MRLYPSLNDKIDLGLEQLQALQCIADRMSKPTGDLGTMRFYSFVAQNISDHLSEGLEVGLDEYTGHDDSEEVGSVEGLVDSLKQTAITVYNYIKDLLSRLMAFIYRVLGIKQKAVQAAEQELKEAIDDNKDSNTEEVEITHVSDEGLKERPDLEDEIDRTVPPIEIEVPPEEQSPTTGNQRNIKRFWETKNKVTLKIKSGTLLSRLKSSDLVTCKLRGLNSSNVDKFNKLFQLHGQRGKPGKGNVIYSDTVSRILGKNPLALDEYGKSILGSHELINKVIEPKVFGPYLFPEKDYEGADHLIRFRDALAGIVTLYSLLVDQESYEESLEDMANIKSGKVITPIWAPSPDKVVGNGFIDRFSIKLTEAGLPTIEITNSFDAVDEKAHRLYLEVGGDVIIFDENYALTEELLKHHKDLLTIPDIASKLLVMGNLIKDYEAKVRKRIEAELKESDSPEKIDDLRKQGVEFALIIKHYKDWLDHVSTIMEFRLHVRIILINAETDYKDSVKKTLWYNSSRKTRKTK